MTNEELAVLIQSGNREKLPELWSQVEKFVALARKRHSFKYYLPGGVETAPERS